MVSQSYSSRTIVDDRGKPIVEKKVTSKREVIEPSGRTLIEKDKYYENQRENKIRKTNKKQIDN